jgi:hypothetical protein
VEKLNTGNYKYIASCRFTIDEPDISAKIMDYAASRFQMPIMRCCVPKYKDFTAAMPEWMQPRWKALPDYIEFTADDVMVSTCHNCSAIFQEQKPDVKIISLCELVLLDENFPYPDYAHEKMAVQDCWRSHDNRIEQEAVRALLKKMNIDVIELGDNYEKTQFCGVSLFMPAPARNLKLASKRFVENAKGKFIQCSEDEQTKLMQEYCKRIPSDKVVAYCHYCVKGLKIGGKQAIHIARLLFNPLYQR